MSLHYRKLLNDSLEDVISKLCEPYCVDPSDNHDGSCPISCISRCFPTCSRPIFPDPPPPPVPPYVDHPDKSRGLSVFLTVSLAVLATIFLIFFCYTVYKFYTGFYQSRRHRQPPPPTQPPEEEAWLDFLDEDHGPVVDHPIWYIRTIGLQPSVISAITVCKYKRGDGLVEGTECSVCLNEFQEDETLRLLPKCNHAFHLPCIDTWLRSHTNCPMCRAGIVINVSTSGQQLPGQSNSVSGHSEESQVGVAENVRESGRDMEDQELRGVRVEVEDEEELGAENVLKRDEEDVAGIGNSYPRQGDGFQSLRRSVSMDSLSASMISSAITNALPLNTDGISEKQIFEMKEISKRVALKRNADQNLLNLSGSSSNGRSLQKGSAKVIRSLSCSAKVFLSRYSSSSSGPLPRSF